MSDVNFDIALSLDKAKLIERESLNSLGSNELILEYNGITNEGKEDCIAELELNRKSLTDPTFGHRTYEGTWYCVSISYRDEKDVIRQRFKIDSAIGDLGVDESITPFADQEGTIAKMAPNEIIQKAYYWRIVDPNIIQLPDTAQDGEVWTKSNTENADGTYDVTVSRTQIIADNIGDLGLITDPITPFEDQEGTLAKMAVNEEIQRAYYWSVADPSLIQIPDAAILGEIWTKTNSKNGDGTYDVTVSRSKNKPFTIGSLGSATPATPDSTVTKRAYSEIVETAYYWRIEKPDDIEIPDTITEGEVWDKRVRENSDGTYSITVSKSTGTDQTGNSEEKIWGEGEDPKVLALTDILVSGAVKPRANQYYQHTSGTLGDIDAVWTGRTNSDWTFKHIINSDFEIPSSNPAGELWQLNSTIDGEEAIHIGGNLNSGAWFTGGGPDYDVGDAYEYYAENLVVQVGFNPPASEVVSTVSTNSEKLEFDSVGGSVADPASGQSVTISNIPTDNGKFRSTVTVTTVNEQRVPALFDAIIFDNNSILLTSPMKSYVAGTGSLSLAKNSTYADFQLSVNNMNLYRSTHQNSVSFSLNKNGLYDYTIRSSKI